jgi:hypothetical protein
MIKPDKSWVARWQRLTQRVHRTDIPMVPGCYAVSVEGEPSTGLLDSLSTNIQWIPGMRNTGREARIAN